MKKIIEDLKAMQRIDYIPDSIGYKLLEDVISLLTMLHDAEACASRPGRFLKK